MRRAAGPGSHPPPHKLQESLFQVGIDRAKAFHALPQFGMIFKEEFFGRLAIGFGMQGEPVLIGVDIVLQGVDDLLLPDELVLEMFQLGQHFPLVGLADEFFEPVLVDDGLVGEKTQFVIPKLVLEVQVGQIDLFYIGHSRFQIKGLPIVSFFYPDKMANAALGENDKCLQTSMIFITERSVSLSVSVSLSGFFQTQIHTQTQTPS